MTMSSGRRKTWSDGFRQRDPAEGAPATQLTRVALAYDDDALYVAARMSSTRPVARQLS
ncbi:MAG: hypothetical protein ABR543_10955 [Gemmatimonadaceae bacterium]